MADRYFIGIFVVLFLAATALLFPHIRTREANIPLLSAICLLFLLCTAHFTLEFNHYYIVLVCPFRLPLRILY